MLRKQLIEQRGFRDLLPEEVEHVSGGLYGNEYLPDDFPPIVVTGSIGGSNYFGGLGLGGIGSIGASSGAGTGGGGSSAANASDNSDNFTDNDGDGLDDNTGLPLTIVVEATPEQIAAAQDGSFFGGFWIAGLLGGQVSGGGGEAHGSAGAGLGGGLELGYSSDSDRALNEGDNTQFEYPGVGFHFDFDPFTIGIEVNTGFYLPVVEMHKK